MEAKVMSYGRMVSKTHAMQEACGHKYIKSECTGGGLGDNFVTLENTCLICGRKTCRRIHIYYDRGRYRYITPGRFNTEEENREEMEKQKIEKELNELEKIRKEKEKEQKELEEIIRLRKELTNKF